ncbi:MAG: tetrahydrofolate dehydrogenase/cyclohydrolase catalytic domain-containing protein [Oscillospiraceae bacterium]
MPKLLTGAPVSAGIYAQVRAKVSLPGAQPCLAAVSVGTQPDDLAYLHSIAQAADAAGIAVRPISLPADCTPDALTGTLRALSADGAVHGVLLLRPLPAALRAQELLDTLDPRKDVDGMTTASLGALVTGAAGFAPARLRRVWPCCAHTGSTRRANAWPSSAGASSSAGRPRCCSRARTRP